MWGRKENALPLDADGHRLATAEPPRPETVSRRPTKASPSTLGPGSVSRLGNSVRFNGKIHSEEDLLIDGKIQGTISIPEKLLVIGPQSEVHAEVRAHSVQVCGKLKGDVSVSNRFEIKKTGQFEGNLVTHRIAVEDGAVFRGTCEVKVPERPAPKKPKAPKRPEASRVNAAPAAKA